MAVSLRLNQTIDAKNIFSFNKEKKKGREILYRLLDITLFLAKQNLTFRGHCEDASSLNKGNFLKTVELLPKYDPVLKEHFMKYTESAKRGFISYLSQSIQNGFISVLANHVKQKLIAEIKDARYFGLMFDSTQGISRIDKMSEGIRYISIKDRKVEVKEVFLGFFIIKGKKAKDHAGVHTKTVKAVNQTLDSN